MTNGGGEGRGGDVWRRLREFLLAVALWNYYREHEIKSLQCSKEKDLIYLPSFYNEVDSGRRSLVQLAGVRQTDSGLRCQRYQKHKYNRIERSATTLYFDLMAYGNIAPTCLSVCLSTSFMDISFVSSWGENGERVL